MVEAIKKSKIGEGGRSYLCQHGVMIRVGSGIPRFDLCPGRGIMLDALRPVTSLILTFLKVLL